MTTLPQNPIGEIVESTTTTFVAQCLEVPRQPVMKLFDPPAFGVFVKILRPGASAPEPQAAPLPPDEDEIDPFVTPAAGRPAPPQSLGGSAIYALVYGSATASLEPFRRAAALGYDEDELRAYQPQIFELLRTEFRGMLVAYTDGTGVVRRHLPPTPPRIHSRVLPCDSAEVRALTSDLSFLRGVLVAGGSLDGVPVDELAAACLREARQHQLDDRAFLLRAGKSLAAILAEDYDRLQAILRNVI